MQTGETEDIDIHLALDTPNHKRDRLFIRNLKDEVVKSTLDKRLEEPPRPGDLYRFISTKLALDIELMVLIVHNDTESKVVSCLATDLDVKNAGPFDYHIPPSAISGERLVNLAVGCILPAAKLPGSGRTGYVERFRVDSYVGLIPRLPIRYALHLNIDTMKAVDISTLPVLYRQRIELLHSRVARLAEALNKK